MEDAHMERNDFGSGDSTQDQASGSSALGSSGSTGSQSGGYSGSMSDEGQSVTDRARDIAGSAEEKLADVGSTVRERAGNAKDSLAGALEAGADKLRQRSGDGQLAGAGGANVSMGDGRMAKVTTSVAGRMDATAHWLRDADLDGLRTGLETQVKEHPGRTLLLAVGVGYLLGKALRK
jgi:hypothetical protein